MGTGREVLRSFGELMHDRVEPVYAEDVLQAGMLANDYPGVSAQDLVHWDWAVMQRAGAGASSRRTLTVTVQTCGDLRDIRPLVEGQPSTEFPLQTAFVPLNVNSYALAPTIRSGSPDPNASPPPWLPVVPADRLFLRRPAALPRAPQFQPAAPEQTPAPAFWRGEFADRV